MAYAADADTFIHAVVRNGRTAELSAADRARCEHAVTLTAHQRSMTPADLDILRGHGFDDVAIRDATQVIDYFNYITRIVDGLGVPPEEFIDPPGGV
ncbi:MAG: hypothetical protein KDD78_06855 [Caldilineaceae bacterium]|nr:hypothetical protein [Caldilineaceae bacterium]